MASAGSPRQQKVAHIRAGDQEHATRGRYEDHERHAAIAEDIFLQRHYRYPDLGIRFRKLRRELPGDRAHVRLRLMDVSAAPEASNYVQEMTVAATEDVRLQPEGQP